MSFAAAGASTGDPRLAIGGAVIDFGLNLFGRNQQANAAADAAREKREQAEKQHKHDLEGWEMRWDKLNADRAWVIEGNRIKARNEERLAQFKDATNEAQYLHQLAIRNREQASLENQFAKSNVLYDEQITANARAAKMASDSEWRQLDEINSEAAFNAQEQRLEYLQAEGKMRASGASGRSAGKVHQAAMASFGFKVAALNEGLASAGRNTKAMLEEIKDDHYSANLAAFANKMLDPGKLPMPIRPFRTPRAEYQGPRPLEAFDKGPEPIMGGYTSPEVASAAVWGAAIPSLAASAGGGFKAWADTQ